MDQSELSDHLDRDSVVPLYFQLQEILKEKIEIGLWSAGEALPPEADLCATYGVSRTVVRQALAILEQDRQIIRVRGSGTFVATPKVEQRAGGFSRLLAIRDTWGAHHNSRRPHPDCITPHWHSA